MAIPKINLTEYQEQCLLVEWLELMHFKFSKLAQDTFTRNWGTKIKNQKSGVRLGVPDMMIILPGRLVFIEMKRCKGGTISEAQRDWITELNKLPSVTAAVCHGFEEAKTTIEKILNKKRDLEKSC
jgi:hypothetical protein